MLTSQMIKNITQEYYSYFTGINLAELEAGNYFIPLPERNGIMKGYGCKYTVYLLEKGDSLVISYSPKYEEFMEKIKSCSKDKIMDTINRKFSLQKKALMIFDKETINNYDGAKILKATDYGMYEEFFCEMYPNVDTEGWLYDYFTDKAKREYFTGYIVKDRLVAVCDAPDMPYMEGVIQHTGISTLEHERRKGYAKITAALATHQLLEREICPQWDCDAGNIASIELAKSIGYLPYANCYFFEE